MISDDFYLWLTSHAHCEPQFGTAQHSGSFMVQSTVAEDSRISVYQNSEAASAYHSGPALA
jgi:hypothetical protein